MIRRKHRWNITSCPTTKGKLTTLDRTMVIYVRKVTGTRAASPRATEDNIQKSLPALGNFQYLLLKIRQVEDVDRSQINKIIQPMGSLQPGIPLHSLLPKEWPIIVIDLKDCFFTIPLHECDKERFAFSIPNFNRDHPVKRYQWKVLPQEC